MHLERTTHEEPREQEQDKIAALDNTKSDDSTASNLPAFECFRTLDHKWFLNAPRPAKPPLDIFGRSKDPKRQGNL